ncbi:MAG: DEAD/DEAH box helicase, partial [Myxococcales bacterium]
MRAIRLRELEREAPVCASFDDEEAVRRYECEVREHRAYSEPYLVTPLDDRIDGAYQVESTSGVPHLVDIVDGSGEHDGCACPDFLTSGLGTCKHLEAVRRAIAGNRARRALFERLPSSPAQPVLAVRGAGEPALIAVGPWQRRPSLRRLGLEPAPDGTVTLPRDFDLATLAPVVRVTHGASAWRSILRQRAVSEGRSQRLRRAVRKFSTDLLTRPLFPYQIEGVKHLLGRGRALLADDMGLGKTVQTIAACETLLTLGEARTVLIVCPASLKAQWASEILRYTGKDALVIGGPSSQRRHQLRSDAAYKVMNYEVTWRELDVLRELDADVLVLDEAQRAKNFRTKTAATLRQIPSRFLFVLTGTPVENRLDDLYSLMQLVDPRLLGPLWRFNHEFHEQGRTGKILAYKNLGALRERIAPAVLRRRKEEVLTQLPPITFQTRYTALSPRQVSLEEEYRQRAAKLARVAEHRPLTREETQRLLAYLLKARQACDAAELCDPQTDEPGSPKLDEFEGLIAEICEQGTAKILVFSEWVEMLKLAARRLVKLGVGYTMLHGGIPTDRRPALLDHFRADPNVRVLLSSDAGGTGLNLQVASYILHLDLPWNPARLDQRTARAHR